MLNDDIRMAFLNACDGDHDEALSVLAAYAAHLRNALGLALRRLDGLVNSLPPELVEALDRITIHESASRLPKPPLT
jgi:hypothetical protein